ncbi:MAG: NAD-dependent epimerase/dehydratase family protein [Aliishimia sp.]
MKIVITGGLGFIGKNFALYMQNVAPEYDLHCVDWLRSPKSTDLDLFTSVLSEDFASNSAKSLFTDADVVVHLAATTTVQESIQNPFGSFDNNVIKTQLLLEHLRFAAPNGHFIFASTGGAIIGAYDGPIHEGIPPMPVSPYGATKLAVEGMLSAYTGSFGMKTAALRFSNVYGPNSRHKTSVVSTFCRDYLDAGRLTVNGDGLQTRDYVYVEDICQAIWKTIKTHATGPFQLGTGVATSILDLIQTLKSHDPGREIDVVHSEGLRGEVKHNVCDISLARRKLSFAPKYDLDRGLSETMKWFENA